MAPYVIAALTYLLVVGVVSFATAGKARVLVLAGVLVAGLVVLVPVRGVVWPMPVCGAGGLCAPGGSSATTLIGVPLRRVGEPDAAIVGLVAGLLLTSVGMLTAWFLTKPRFVSRHIDG
jgi:hypothetical protein